MRGGILVDTIGAVWFIITLVIAIILVNAAYRLFMKIVGADGMFYSIKSKIIAIIIVWLILAGLGLKVVGIA